MPEPVGHGPHVDTSVSSSVATKWRRSCSRTCGRPVSVRSRSQRLVTRSGRSSCTRSRRSSTFWQRTTRRPPWMLRGRRMFALIATGVLVARLALYVVLADDGAVEIIYLEIDNPQ